MNSASFLFYSFSIACFFVFPHLLFFTPFFPSFPASSFSVPFVFVFVVFPTPSLLPVLVLLISLSFLFLLLLLFSPFLLLPFLSCFFLPPPSSSCFYCYISVALPSFFCFSSPLLFLFFIQPFTRLRRVGPGYNDIGVCDNPSITLYILRYQ